MRESRSTDGRMEEGEGGMGSRRRARSTKNKSKKFQICATFLREIEGFLGIFFPSFNEPPELVKKIARPDLAVGAARLPH